MRCVTRGEGEFIAVLLTAEGEDEGAFLAALHEALGREPKQIESELVTHGGELFQLMLTKSG